MSPGVRGDEPLSHEGPFYRLSLLPPQWAPPRHDYGDIKVDVSAVGPWMCRMAGEVADGVHVHPLHSEQYLRKRLLPAVMEGASTAARSASDIDLIIPVFAVSGDTPEERAFLLQRARSQIAFYGTTQNYAFQFDDLGFEGTSARLNALMKAGDLSGMASAITDEMLEHYAVVCQSNELADKLLRRYGSLASRLVMYLAQDSIERDPQSIGKLGEVATAVASLVETNH